LAVLSASATTVMYNEYVTLWGRHVVGSTTTSPVPLEVWIDSGGAWSKVGLATYDGASGVYGLRFRVSKTAAFVLRSPEGRHDSAAISRRVTVVVRRHVALGAKSTVRYGRKVRVKLVVKAPSPQRTRIARAWYNRRAKRWVAFKGVTPRVTSANARCAWLSSSVALRKRGRWRLTGVHTVGTTSRSRPVYVTVR
jgi:hypothetical protein